MVSMKRADRNPVYGAKLSSVVPASVTGDDNVRHELANEDLAMKLHYIKGVYAFREDAVRGLSIYELKKPMFCWLDLFPAASGRIRRMEEDDGGGDSFLGRPFVKCNDSGVRIVEARCELTVDEWLSGTEEGLHSADTLAYDQVLGPDLGFSPLVYVQFTWFKCGGISLGLSWAHLLGDFFSASSFINLWAHLLSGHVPPSSLHVPPPPPPTPTDSPSPFKPVAPVGDLWIAPSCPTMGKLSLRVTPEQLERLHALSGLVCPLNLSAFELISAVLWKSISRARADRGTRTAVVSERRHAPRGDAFESPVNAMVFGRAEADFSVAEAKVEEILGVIRKRTGGGWAIEHPAGDYVAYGAELTLVDLEGLDVGGVEINGEKAVFASYTVGGVGEGGAVVVLPEVAGKGMGRRLNVILPEAELGKVREELTVNWGL